MAAVYATLTLRIVDTETGIWCDGCLLPSAVKVTYMACLGAAEFGPVGSVQACRDCGNSDHGLAG